ncbi:MAG: hypothetical protein IPJ55_00005 [Chloracidobacterium sp.]|nr:hypothetical protein [Chloracidobacterium sp.]
MHNADRTKWIVFNGEIYNYRELRADLEKRGHGFYTNSDTEAIIHLYDEYGADCLQYLRGMFADSHLGQVDRSLFLARDRVGKKPILYSHQPNGDLIFGSEFLAILKHPSVTRGRLWCDRQLFFNLASRRRRPRLSRYVNWNPATGSSGKTATSRLGDTGCPIFQKIKISEDEAIQETTRILRESTKLRMISEVPLGAFLSGGVDSSIVVALMAQESAAPVNTFSGSGLRSRISASSNMPAASPSKCRRRV